ncbi:MAG: RNA-binding protein [Candidatus Diapherotrites archaeon]|nr:RNA-binding protein [Candidatus Diapherotrites archaeon]
MAVKCTSCKKDTEEYISFKCPQCGRELFRCLDCRHISAAYVCPKCGFRGP